MGGGGGTIEVTEVVAVGVADEGVDVTVSEVSAVVKDVGADEQVVDGVAGEVVEDTWSEVSTFQAVNTGSIFKSSPSARRFLYNVS